MRLTTLGVGALNSPRYAPAGLLTAHRGARVMIDGGPGAVPRGRIDAWLVTDERAELISAIRRLAQRHGLVPRVGSFSSRGLRIVARPVVHTSHPTYAYLIRVGRITVAWAPEFFRYPPWARKIDLMFAEAAGWDRPIRFAGATGGHLDALTISMMARRRGVKRLVFAHIGRPTLRAIDRGDRPPFGEFAAEGQRFLVRRARRVLRRLPTTSTTGRHHGPS